jgi:hypothetical protein
VADGRSHTHQPVVSTRERLHDRIARHWADDSIRTHSESCWQWHPRCAIDYLHAQIGDLESEADELRERIRELAIENDQMRARHG